MDVGGSINVVVPTCPPFPMLIPSGRQSSDRVRPSQINKCQPWLSLHPCENHRPDSESKQGAIDEGGIVSTFNLHLPLSSTHIPVVGGLAACSKQSAVEVQLDHAADQLSLSQSSIGPSFRLASCPVQSLETVFLHVSGLTFPEVPYPSPPCISATTLHYLKTASSTPTASSFLHLPPQPHLSSQVPINHTYLHKYFEQLLFHWTPRCSGLPTSADLVHRRVRRVAGRLPHQEAASSHFHSLHSSLSTFSVVWITRLSKDLLEVSYSAQIGLVRVPM